MNYFDEKWYLEKYPDVRNAIAQGNLDSALDHFRTRGRAEGRLACDPKLLARFTEADKQAISKVFYFDRLWVTNEGTALIFGWIDNRSDRIRSLSFAPYVGDPIPLERYILRVYRADVAEKKVEEEKNQDYGVWIPFDGLANCRPYLGGRARIEFASGCTAELEIAALVVSPEEMRGRILDAVSAPRRSHCSLAELCEITGPILRRLNAEVLARSTIGPPVAHGSRLRAPSLSILVAFQRIDSMLRQAAMFAGLSSIGNVEFVWVSNHPADASMFHAVAESAHTLYGLNIVSVVVSEHFGFAAAINHGAQIATGKALLFLNSGVIPGDRDCLTRALRAAEINGEKDVVGARLLTENNAIQNIGRFFTLSDCVNGLWRYQDANKGMPVHHFDDGVVKEVDAVAATAMLVRRSSFIDLGGFNERYLTDECQDSDYCLRARRGGGRITIDPSLLFYHLETGAGIQRRPREWAASLMDRVFFNETWRSTIERRGRAPGSEIIAHRSRRAESGDSIGTQAVNCNNTLSS